MQLIRHLVVIGLFVLVCAVIAVRPEDSTLSLSTPLPANAAPSVSAFSNGAGPTATPACAASWSVVESPNPSTSFNFLLDVAAISSNDVWAVGDYGSGNARSFALHWDGLQWSVVPTPHVGTASTDNLLSGVAALATNDVWAVGFARGGGVSQPLILHWDGSAWSVVLSPNPPGAGDPSLWGISALAPDYIWAVGSYVENAAQTTRTLVEFWNGVSWSIVPSPNPQPYPDPTDNVLQGVAAISPSDVWATGWSFRPTSPRTLVEHWDGSVWSVVPSPNLPGDSNNQLFGAAAVSSTDVWTVGAGFIQGSRPPARNLTMRWDGNLWRWSIVPIPNPGVGDNRLTSVTALSSNDVWAVGNILTDIRGDTLIEHWDGSQWTWIPSVSPGAYHNTLDGVAAISSEDVWAVGSLTNCIGCEFFSLIEHYFNPCVTPSPTPSGTPPTLSPTRTRTPTPTGTRPTNSPTWTFVPTSTGTPTTTATATLTPRPCEPETNYIITESLGATVVPGTVDIGNHCDDCTTTIDLPFPFTFYGQTFTSANVSSNGNIQFASNDPSHDNVCVPYAPVRYAILPHWDDLHTENAGCFDCGIFTSVTGSAPNRIFNIEWDTTFLSSGSFPVSFQLRLYENSPEQRFDIIYDSISRQGSSATVGIQRGPNEAFVQYECNTAGSITGGLQLSFTLAPCPPPSATPSSSFTPTVTPATTNTVTPCPMAFIDVREADYFYVPVRYLYCAGVISGYADNTFRPYNNTTRGQLCKIVVLAEGWPLQCPANPTFSDVPVDNTFFCYVETAVSHGTISGYSDGTFRPYNNVTRGQLCKIVVLARGWEADCTTQHFSDVPPSHPFFCYIEVAFNHEIISGYADGTFRPGNSAIRGQISKIAYNALTSP